MLTANLFSQLASDPSTVAYMVNIMSALLSALTILFLFWSITHLAKRLIVRDEESMTLGKLIAIQASGLVGALIYTFSDTFWFSAVEGEVYAYSSAFTAIVFWLILKWESHADEPHSDRYIVLIAYMTGLSIGVHLLNLLCLPAIVLVYSYRRFKNIELKGSLIALALSFAIVAGVLYGVVPGIITVAGWFELLFVNVLGCPFNTGEIIYIILLVSCVVWSIYESYANRHFKRQNLAFVLSVGMLGIPFYGYGWSAAVIGIVALVALWFVLNYRRKIDTKLVPLVTARFKNTVMLCLLMLMIGYSTYAVIVIRSSANPPMDQNSPEDVFTLGSYLSRDQYGDRPLLYGQAYTSQVAYDIKDNYCVPKSKEGAPIWQRKEKASADEKDSYFIVSRKNKYVFAQNMLFPRMHSSSHAQAYESWLGGIDGYDVPYDACGEQMMVKMPTQIDNIRFFLSYQCNFMYWRYFMWNFAGRQNDKQGNGELEHGNWITGFPFIDNFMLGDQSKLPSDLKDNKGHNVFYCMPLLLGLIGLFWQAWRGRRGIRQFWVVFFLFFMTGLAIVIYLNQTPLQPRERDYAYAGSFYAYSIWCGLGVLAIYDLLKRYVKGREVAVASVVGLVCLCVPVQMASQTWDDHDRSGRYTCRDFGQNYLMSLSEKGNPIVFTNGDNDTFPLWYNQDVEGVRTDARVCNLSYLQTDWYIDQMKRPAYDSPSVPISWSRLEYCAGTNDYVKVDPSLKESILLYYESFPEDAAKEFGGHPFELKNALRYFARSRDLQMHVIPTDTLFITIDKDAVRRSGMMIPCDSIPDRMVISLKGHRALYKNDLMMLEMLANSNWTRPLYVATTVGSDNYLTLGNNFIQEGLVCRITPFHLDDYNNSSVMDTERTYDLVMNHFRYGGLDKPGVYIDETVMRMCFTHRNLMTTLAANLAAEGKNDKAVNVLRLCEKVFPEYNVPYSYRSGIVQMAMTYLQTGCKKDAKRVMLKALNNTAEYVRYYLQLPESKFGMYDRDTYICLYFMKDMVSVMQEIDEPLGKQWHDKLFSYYKAYNMRAGVGDE